MFEIGEILRLIEKDLTNSLEFEGLTRAEKDYENRKFFARSLSCPMNSEEMTEVVKGLKKVIIESIKKECGSLENVTFIIRNVESLKDNDTDKYLMRGCIHFGKEETESTNGFILESCPQLVNSIYADGREAQNECGNSSTDEKCSEVKDCPFKKVAENLLRVVKANHCSNCDGCGYDNGCGDTECGTHTAYKCLDLLGLQCSD